MPETGHGGVQPAQERLAGAGRDASDPLRVLIADLVREELDEVGERPDREAVSRGPVSTAFVQDAGEHHGCVGGRRDEHHCAALILQGMRPAGELQPDPLLDKGDLAARVFVLGEAEAKQALSDEGLRWPAVRGDFGSRTAGDVGHDSSGPAPGSLRSVDLYVVEGARSVYTQCGPAFEGTLTGGDLAVGSVQMEQVLAFDVEHQRAGRGRVLTEQRTALLGLQQHVEQERRVRGLGSYTAYPAYRDVPAARTVYEGEVGVHGLTELVIPHGQWLLHLIQEQRAFAFGASSRPDDGSRRRR